MGGKKKRSLLSELSTVTDQQITKTGRKRWCDVLRESQPEAYESIREVVEDWLRGGRMKTLFPSRRLLLQYFQNKHPSIPCDPPVITEEIYVETFWRLAQLIESEMGNGKTKTSR